MTEDSDLLSRYVKYRSQEAFAELVRRHIGLVYSCAFRRVGNDSHLAEDVAQMVFSDFARKGPSLLGRSALSGWLYVSTQLASAEVVRKERRRKIREEEASFMQSPSSVVAAPSEDDWNRIRPMLDKFILGLREEDREALVLRFFSKQGYSAIGATLGVSEDAARKRVERALDRLRGLLAKGGATSTIEALSIVLAEDASAAPPALLADRVASIAFLEFTAAGTVASFVASLFSAMTSEAAVMAATMVAGALLVLWQEQTNTRLRAESVTAITPNCAGNMTNLCNWRRAQMSWRPCGGRRFRAERLRWLPLEAPRGKMRRTEPFAQGSGPRRQPGRIGAAGARKLPWKPCFGRRPVVI